MVILTNVHVAVQLADIGCASFFQIGTLRSTCNTNFEPMRFVPQRIEGNFPKQSLDRAPISSEGGDRSTSYLQQVSRFNCQSSGFTHKI